MYKETDLGFELQIKNTLIFFGKKGCSLQDLKSNFSDIEFRTVHQIHSDVTVCSSGNSEAFQADAHYTQEMNVGLVIKTADCIPALIHIPNRNIIMAIHAGWRGVQNQITLKAFRQLQLTNDDEVSAYIGPHILQKSFEVQADVKNLLLNSTYNTESDLTYQIGGKYYVDLQKILKSQIHAVVESAAIHCMNLDTFNNELFNSYRSDQTPFRNLSFIVQKASSV